MLEHSKQKQNIYILVSIVVASMALFWQKKREIDVSEALVDEVKRLKARITRVESEVLEVMTAQEIIRNKVLRKIQGKRKPEEEEENEEVWAGIPRTRY